MGMDEFVPCLSEEGSDLFKMTGGPTSVGRVFFNSCHGMSEKKMKVLKKCSFLTVREQQETLLLAGG